jgi:hypothetical protein
LELDPSSGVLVVQVNDRPDSGPLLSGLTWCWRLDQRYRRQIHLPQLEVQNSSRDLSLDILVLTESVGYRKSPSYFAMMLWAM